MNKIYWLVVFLLGVFTLAGSTYLYDHREISINDLSLENFARCMQSKGATMYGAYWCPHCQNEKNNFGQYFKYINYVECPENIKLCENKKIMSYPVWEFSDGSQLVGEQGLKKLSDKTGCLLNEMSMTAIISPTK